MPYNINFPPRGLVISKPGSAELDLLVDWGTEIAGQAGRAGALASAALGPVLAWQTYIEQLKSDQEKASALALLGIIRLYGALNVENAWAIESLYQQEPRHNDTIYAVVFQRGGVGWIDVTSLRAYWHPNEGFMVIRSEYYVKKNKNYRGTNRLEGILHIPGSVAGTAQRLAAGEDRRA